jgi:hypothetical protein
MAVFGQWTRAEPGFRRKTPAELQADHERRPAELDKKIGHTSAVVRELSQQVGDVETVADKHGWLPSERRNLALTLFEARRVMEVRELRERVTVRRAELEEAKGRSERAPLRDALRKDTRRLEFLETIPPLTASDMCSECVTPIGWHGFRFEPSDACPERGPCPTWPLWQQQVQQAREILLSSAAKKAPRQRRRSRSRWPSYPVTCRSKRSSPG